MPLAVRKIEYPYVVSNRDIAGGSPIIEGTRVTVNCIAGYYQMGMSADEILNSLRHLTPSQVYSALAYYFDHQDEIDSDLEKATNIEHWKKQAQSRLGQNEIHRAHQNSPLGSV